MCKFNMHKKNHLGFLQPNHLYLALSRQLVHPLPICSQDQVSKSVLIALSFLALSIEDSQTIPLGIKGCSMEEADTFIITNYLDGVNPNNDQPTNKWGPANRATTPQTFDKDTPTQSQIIPITISPQPTTKPDSPPSAQKGPSYADSLLLTATSHSSEGIAVGGFTRQLSLRVI
eukprot:9871635-Ditylum_brightwellii.AAC.1